VRGCSVVYGRLDVAKLQAALAFSPVSPSSSMEND